MALKISDLIDMTVKANRYIGKSSEIPNGSADLPIVGVTQGSTYYVADTGVTYIFYKDQWYEMA